MPSPLAARDLLLIEDEPLLRKRLAAFLERAGASVTAVGNLADARRALAGMPFDLALSDVNLPDGNALDLLREKAYSENTLVVVMTAEGGVPLAVEALRLGAADFLAKPFDTEELPLVFARALRSGRESRIKQHDRIRRSPSPSPPVPQAASAVEDGFYFGNSLGELRAQLERVLETDRRLGENLPPVLIEGPTGTGKTSLARWLHRRGPLAEKEIVEVNCAAIPENLVESELFGHERGAFTDAKAARMGLFEAASGGTLFLDEIASLPSATQAKLLKVLEDKRIRRVGGTRDLPVDARIIAASNVPLRQLVAEKSFREDLYHRLNLLHLDIPPLRQRGEDIVALARHLLAGLAIRYRLPKASLSPLGERQIRSHPWPGNVRELSHELERALIMQGAAPLEFRHLAATTGDGPANATAAADDPPDWLTPAFRFPDDGSFSFEEACNRLVRNALEQADGNVSAAARLLGTSRDTVRYRLQQKAPGSKAD